jgi:predicted O-methyltransferase YrrM
MTFEDAWKFASHAEGWLSEPQAQALFDAAGQVPVGQCAVEVGSHCAKSTIMLAAGLRDGVGLTAVDPFDDERWGGGPGALVDFEGNLETAGLRDRVTLVRGRSGEAARAWAGPEVGLAWIDGAHDLASVLIDIDGWGAHLAEGGLLYIHDAFSALGTTEAVLRRLWFSSDFRYIGCERTLVEFRKERLSRSAAIRSGLSLSRRLPFFVRMVAIKAARRSGHRSIERMLMRSDNEPLI